MPMDMSADNLAMLDSTEFGATTLTFKGTPISGIFDAAYFEILDVNGGVESSSPGVLCRGSDVTGVRHGDAIVAEGTSYVVVGIKPDGTGMTELALELQ